MNEFVIEWLKGQTVATITAPNGSTLKTKIVKLATDRPAECNYIENNDGSILGHIPTKYLKINPPRNISAEMREVLRKNLGAVRQ